MLNISYDAVLKEENIFKIRNIIKKNGTLIYPTDTLYGLGGNFFSEHVHRTINRLKNRKNLPYSVVVSGLEQIKTLTGALPDIFFELYPKLLPGKFTFLLPLSASACPPHLKKLTKIGIRIPDTPLLLKLIERLNVFLISTSVNRSGQKPLSHPRTIRRCFPEVDLFIDRGPMKPSRGSTVLDLTLTPVRCIRKGDDFDRLGQIGLLFAEK